MNNLAVFLVALSSCFYASVVVASQSTGQLKPEPSTNSQQHLLESDTLIASLSEKELSELFDVDVALLPDWETNTPTKLAQKSSLSPANVYVVSKDEIRKFGYRQLSEILSHVAGLVMTSDLALSNFGARGIHPGTRAGSRVIKFMLDGQPFSYRANQQNWIDRNLIPVEIIERIEIVKGPVSALYGADAFLGVVNVVTQNGGDIRIKGHVASLEYQNTTRAGDGYYLSYVGGQQTENWNSVFGVTLGDIDRSGLKLPITSPNYQSITENENQTLASQQDHSQPFALYVKARRQGEDNDFWQLGLHYQRQNEDIVFSDITPLSVYANNHDSLDNGFASIEYSTSLTQGLDWYNKLAYSAGGPRSGDQIELGAESFYYHRRWGYTALDFTSEIAWQASESSMWLFGLSYNDEEHKIESFDRIERVDGSRTQVSPPEDLAFANVSLYSQLLYKLSDSINSIVGYRYDSHDVYDDQHSLRLGGVWSLDNANSFKLLYGSSFQAPSPELLYRNPAQRGDIQGNPHLAPQRARTLELIFQHQNSNNWHFDFTLYQTRVYDLVVYRNNLNNLQAENATRSVSTGLEANTSYKSDALHLYANFSWQHTDIDATSMFILENREHGELFPGFSANFGAHYRFKDPSWSLALNNRYVGKRNASTSNVLVAETFYQLDDYLDTSLLIQKTFNLLPLKQTNLVFKISDLWDEAYVNPGFSGIDYPSYGRRFNLIIEQRF